MRQRPAELDLGDGLGLQQVAVLVQQRAIGSRGAKRADRKKDRVGVREVRSRFLDDAAQVLERLALRVEHGAHAPVERQAAEIRAPRDARAAKVALERAAKHGRIRRQQTTDRAGRVPP